MSLSPSPRNNNTTNNSATETLASRLPTILASDADFCFGSPEEALVALGSSLNPSALSDREQLLRHIEVLTFHNQRMALALIAHTRNGEELLQDFRQNHEGNKRNPENVQFDEAAQELAFRHMRTANVRLGMLYEKMREKLGDVETDAKRNEQLVMTMQSKLRDAEQAAFIGEGAKSKLAQQEQEIQSLRKSESDLMRKIQLLESTSPSVTFLNNNNNGEANDHYFESPNNRGPRHQRETKNVKLQVNLDNSSNSPAKNNISNTDGNNHNNNNVLLEQSLLQCALAELEEEESSERQRICIGAGNVVALRRRILELEIVGLEQTRREEDNTNYASQQLYAAHRDNQLLEDECASLRKTINSLERRMEEVAISAWKAASFKLQDAMANVRFQIQERVDQAYSEGHRDGLELLANRKPAAVISSAAASSAATTAPANNNSSSSTHHHQNSSSATGIDNNSTSQAQQHPHHHLTLEDLLAQHDSDTKKKAAVINDNANHGSSSGSSPNFDHHPTEGREQSPTQRPTPCEEIVSFSPASSQAKNNINTNNQQEIVSPRQRQRQHKVRSVLRTPISTTSGFDDEEDDSSSKSSCSNGGSHMSSRSDDSDNENKYYYPKKKDIDLVKPGRHHRLRQKPPSSKKRRRSPRSPHTFENPPPPFPQPSSSSARKAKGEDDNNTTNSNNTQNANSSLERVMLASPRDERERREANSNSGTVKQLGIPPLAVHSIAPAPASSSSPPLSSRQHHQQHTKIVTSSSNNNSGKSTPVKATPLSLLHHQQQPQQQQTDPVSSANTTSIITPRNPKEFLPNPQQQQQDTNNNHNNNNNVDYNSLLKSALHGTTHSGMNSIGDMSSIEPTSKSNSTTVTSTQSSPEKERETKKNSRSALEDNTYHQNQNQSQQNISIISSTSSVNISANGKVNKRKKRKVPVNSSLLGSSTSTSPKLGQPSHYHQYPRSSTNSTPVAVASGRTSALKMKMMMKDEDEDYYKDLTRNMESLL